MIIAAISVMAFIDPATDALTAMAWAAVLLGFSSATQDVVLDAYRIESAESDLQALMSSSYVAGYRVGMLIAGAGALYIASYLGSTMDEYSYSAWKWSYLVMAMMMSIGLITTLIINEPEQKNNENLLQGHDYLGFLVLFIMAVTGFILTYSYSSPLALILKEALQPLLINS
ncbi:MFS transporter, partial [Pseudomonadota bacterium]|nr:MFS transporter [Pseudomonadota bacterium]